MFTRSRRLIFAAALAAAAVVRPAAAQKLPAPTADLKDFIARGFISLSLPGGKETTDADGNKVIDPGLKMSLPVFQAYVRPDRMLVQIAVAGTVQNILVQADTERTYSAAAGCIVERSYRNLEPAAENPMTGAQLSLVTYARVIADLETGKILPDEDLAKVEEQDRKRIEELNALREKLAKSTDPADVTVAQDAVTELARVRDDLEQIRLRREHPCTMVQFDNGDLLKSLLSRGLTGDRSLDFLSKGKTTFWVTKAHGLPIRMETTDTNGRVALYFCYTALRINGDLKPGELVLGAPAGVPLVRGVADLRVKSSIEKMEEEIARQIFRMAQARATPPAPRPAPGLLTSPGEKDKKRRRKD
jgi:hypothetical protein